MSALPFTVEDFLQVFVSYNESVWPVHLVAYALGIWSVYLAVTAGWKSKKNINRILSLLWIWIGFVYHILFFTAINGAAYFFGALFILQGLIFLTGNRAESLLSYKFQWDIYGITGLLMILYAMIIYPVLGHLLGHQYPEAPVFGLAPCPTVIFTLGLMLWTSGKVSYRFIVIPFLWSLVGFSAAWQLGIYEDFGLVFSGILATGLILYRNRRSETNSLKSQSLYEA